MCTLILNFRPGDVLVADNRDEDLDRPASGPRIWPEPWSRPGRRIFAPRDEEAGGTWLGINEQGVFAGITNRFGAKAPAGARSRGMIVLDALGQTSAAEAARHIAGMSSAMYAGFHLVVADVSGAFVVIHDGAGLRYEALLEGIHVITERSFGAGPTRRPQNIGARLEALGAEREISESMLQAVLGTHDPEESLEGVCVHREDLNYGTRSAAIVRLGAGPRFLYAQGAPCRNGFEDLTGAVDWFR